MSADTRLWTKDFVAVTLANFFLMINYFMLIVVMADYAMTTFDASPALAGTASVFFVVYSASMLVTRPQAGRIFDRRGHRGPAILRAAHRRAGVPGRACGAGQFHLLYPHGHRGGLRPGGAGTAPAPYRPSRHVRGHGPALPVLPAGLRPHPAAGPALSRSGCLKAGLCLKNRLWDAVTS